MDQEKNTLNMEQKEREEQEERLRIAQRAREPESPEELKRIVEEVGAPLKLIIHHVNPKEEEEKEEWCRRIRKRARSL